MESGRYSGPVRYMAGLPILHTTRGNDTQRNPSYNTATLGSALGRTTIGTYSRGVFMMRTISRLAVVGLFCLGTIGCSTAPKSAVDQADLKTTSAQIIVTAQKSDPSLKPFFRTAAGYAVFPTVGKGGLIAGGAYGKGVLYEGGKPVGYCDMTQATLGLQAGGQAYTELLFFETPDVLRQFKSSEFTFNAQATAVALKSGAGANAKYANNIAVFTMDETGLMGEAAIGGQKFRYEPMMPMP